MQVIPLYIVYKTITRDISYSLYDYNIEKKKVCLPLINIICSRITKILACQSDGQLISGRFNDWF